MTIQDWLVSFKPGFDPVPFTEKFRSAIAAFAGILLLGLALRHLPGDSNRQFTLLASMAAAAVLLYAVPHSPMTQPWALVCGNLVSALIGWLCSLYISDPLWAAACAVGCSVLAMHLTSSMHPPGGATAMIMVTGAGQFHSLGVWWTTGAVIANTLLALVLALVISYIIPGRRYPAQHDIFRPGARDAVSGIAPEHIEWALSRMDGVIDVSKEDLLEIYRLATERSRQAA